LPRRPWLARCRCGVLVRTSDVAAFDPRPPLHKSRVLRIRPCIAGPLWLVAWWFSARQASAGASPEVRFPSAFAGRVALSDVADIRTVPLRRSRPPHSPAESIGRCRWARPCGFSLTPVAKLLRLTRAGPARVMHPRLFLAAVFRYPAERCTAWPGLCSRQRSWDSVPSQSCSCPQVPGTSSVPTCPPAVFRTAHPIIWSGADRPIPRTHYHWRSAADASPRLLGFASRASHSRRAFAPLGSILPWAFASLRSPGHQ